MKTFSAVAVMTPLSEYGLTPRLSVSTFWWVIQTMYGALFGAQKCLSFLSLAPGTAP